MLAAMLWFLPQFGGSLFAGIQFRSHRKTVSCLRRLVEVCVCYSKRKISLCGIIITTHNIKFHYIMAHITPFARSKYIRRRQRKEKKKQKENLTK